MSRYLRACAVIVACFACAPTAQAAHRHFHHYHNHHYSLEHIVRQAVSPGVTDLIADSARRLNVPERLAVAVSIKEGASCYKVGSLGERGPMQVRPQTARGLGLRPHDCAGWAYAGVLYLKQVLDHQLRYGLVSAISAYNHGWGRVYTSEYGRSVLRIMSNF